MNHVLAHAPRLLPLPLFVLALLFMHAPAAIAQGPRLNTSEPARLVAEPTALGSTQITLKGERLARADTTGFTIQQDVQIFARGTRGAGAFQQLETCGWAPSQMCVRLNYDPWLRQPDRLEFKVVVRGVGDSNLLAVEVLPRPTAPPRIETKGPESAGGAIPVARRAADFDANSFDRLVTLSVKDLTSDTVALVHDKPASIGRLIPGEGYVFVWVPPAVQALPNYYTLKLRNPNGESNTVQLLVVSSPAVMRVSPAAIELVAGDEATARVAVEYVSMQRAEAFVRGEDPAGAWLPVTIEEGGELTGTITLPAALRKTQTVQLKLKNYGGETVTPIPVREVMRAGTIVRPVIPRAEGVESVNTPNVKPPAVIRVRPITVPAKPPTPPRP